MKTSPRPSTGPNPILFLAVLFSLLAAFTAAPAPAATPSMLPGMPPEVKSLRDAILPGEEYEKLIEQWRAYIDEHPASAVARVQLARAMRYEGTAPEEERTALIDEALELDPDCPEALTARADHLCYRAGEDEGLASFREARELALRAVELAPDWPYPHFSLWSLCLTQGLLDEADEHLRALVEKGGIPSQLLDFAYNMRVSARPDAIIITNGDNDTFPPEALRAMYGVRPDVNIVNLSLMNYSSYSTEVFVNRFDGKGPLSAREIASIKRQWMEGDKKAGVPYAWMLLEKVMERVNDGTWKKPVYFSVTVAPGPIDYVSPKRELEGLLWRVIPGERATSADDCCPIGAARTLQLYRDEFRMESATDFGFPWEAESAVRSLMNNYTAILMVTAEECALLGDTRGMRYSYGEAIRLAKFHGDEERAKQYARVWKANDPKNPEPAALLYGN